MTILAFFALHWQLSVLMQSFFQHRYASHRQFSMSKRTERFLHLVTYVIQGPSYLSPRAYALMHRMHHAYSDTPQDPHAPGCHANVMQMMWATAKRYSNLLDGSEQPATRFTGGYPEWESLDRWGNSWTSRLLWGGVITGIYWQFATTPWLFLLLPFHWTLGPIHGAIVNWCGHRYGYRNFDRADDSRNSLALDVVCAGELLQNNHHAASHRPDFACRRPEFDPTYQFLIKPLARLGVIHLRPPAHTAARQERLGA